MASPYSNGKKYTHYGQYHSDPRSAIANLRASAARASRMAWKFWNDRGRFMIYAAIVSSAHQLRRNLAFNRLFSLPHLLVVVWAVVLLYGERWAFHSKVEQCRWDKWEKWPAGADPHHLVLVADPQLIDPHSYPGRPWPLNPLTILITDNYLRRSYNQLQQQLDPDSIFFLGDLFDGGREWKTAHGSFKDPEWGPHPKSEQKYLKSWNKKYGESFWLREYARFGDIFFDPWVLAGARPGADQRRRKLVASLPGNHDLGFGSEVKIPVRERFEAYFGEGNRVDVIGNHTFVSVDTVSWSARSSPEAERHDLKGIYMPTQIFLDGVKRSKQKAVEKELRSQRGEVPEVAFKHRIEELKKADFTDLPKLGKEAPDLPTVLLTHVPLYRAPGTPCGPMREHWPPAKPPKGQIEPVFPDHRNAIAVSRGYQYQNVLGEEDSQELINKIGNVVHAFSGDDHDYCELVHDASQGNVREITVKSISMAMGVPTPGFVMVSMYNPIDAEGKRLAGTGQPTMQTHLCLLPNQLSTYTRYILLGIGCVILLTIRALLVPLLGLPRFALEPENNANGTILPVFKAKMEDYDEYALPAAGFSASRFRHGSGTRDRNNSFTPVGSAKSNVRSSSPVTKSHTSGRKGHGHKSSSAGGGKWGWGQSRDLRIEIKDDFYGGSKWKPASATRSRSRISVVLTELWTTVFRVAWMVLFIFGWFAYKG